MKIVRKFPLRSSAVRYHLVAPATLLALLLLVAMSQSLLTFPILAVNASSSSGNRSSGSLLESLNKAEGVTAPLQSDANATLTGLSDCVGPGGLVQGTLRITSGAVTRRVTASASFSSEQRPSNLVGIPGSCTVTPNVGTCTVTDILVKYEGTLAIGQTVTITYLARVSNAAAPQSQICVRNEYAFDDIPAFRSELCKPLTCSPVGPGVVPPIISEASDQKPGAVLIYNVYTSGATNGNSQNTRINITNTNPTVPAFVHLFFVAESCSVADSYVCLTGNQTASFLTSDLDPGTNGYLVAVAVNETGCPTNHNYLTGDEYVKFSSGHEANLGAIAISQITTNLTICYDNLALVSLNFNGVSYNKVPAVLAMSSVGSKADGNDALLILNRIGGNLGIGAEPLGTLFGILYDDAENALSFNVTGGCQLRSSLSNNFPRTTPRFETYIPAGRTGWLKVSNQTGAIGMTGAVINFNGNATNSAGAFKQGHNLHALTLTTSNFIIPVFPPNC